jgi:20S proteasome alpha/beta subunit
MTFAAGFRFSDGIVLATDSLESDGLTKRSVDKIKFSGNVGNNSWELALTGAGPGGLLDKLFASIRSLLPVTEPYAPKKIETVVETMVAKTRSQYPDEPFRVIVGVCGNLGMERHLYRSDENYLVPVSDHTHVGMGHSLWRMLSENLYQRGMCVADGIRLAVFVMRQAIEYVSDVDEPIQVAHYTFGNQFWESLTRDEIKAIESEVSISDFRDALRKFWRLHNPPTRAEQVKKFRGVRTPGDELTLLDGVKLEELSSAAGRRRASKIFRRNTDRLQQRALQLKARYQEAQSGASLPSDGRSRT